MIKSYHKKQLIAKLQAMEAAMGGPAATQEAFIDQANNNE